MSGCPDYGPLNGLVKRCVRKRRPVKMLLIGGNFSGKTRSALELAAGMVGVGGTICLISAGEAAAEELYADVVAFDRIDIADPELTTRAKAHFGRSAGRLRWDGGGADPRAVLFAMQVMAKAVGPDGVLILDSATDLWDGVKSRVDALSGGDKSKTGLAWMTANPWMESVWDTFETAECHVILCVRAKTEATMEDVDDMKVAVHYPTVPEIRERDRFRGDVRVYLDSLHRARFEGRLEVLNGKRVPLLTPQIGTRLKELLAVESPEPAAAPAADATAPAATAEAQTPDASVPGGRRRTVHPAIPAAANAATWEGYLRGRDRLPEGHTVGRWLAALAPEAAVAEAERLTSLLNRLPDADGMPEAFESLADEIGDQLTEAMLGWLGVSAPDDLSTDHLGGLCAAMLQTRDEAEAAT